MVRECQNCAVLPTAGVVDRVRVWDLTYCAFYPVGQPVRAPRQDGQINTKGNSNGTEEVFPGAVGD